MYAITHNLPAANAQRQLNINTKHKGKASEKLSSGYRINRSADDAAGLAISEKMRQQIRGLKRGTLNCQDGISLINVADGAMGEIADMLHRASELCIQAANDTYSDDERNHIQQEITNLVEEIDHIGSNTTFNGIRVLQGTPAKISTVTTTETITTKEFVGRTYGEIQYQYDEDIYNYLRLTGSLQHLSDYTGSFSINFSKIQTKDDYEKLDGVAFYYTCSQCDAKTTYIFDNTRTDIQQDYKYKIDGFIMDTDLEKTFIIGTKNMQTGQDFLNAVASLDRKADFVEVTLSTTSMNLKDTKCVGNRYHNSPYAQIRSGRIEITDIYEDRKTTVTVEKIIEEPQDLSIHWGANAKDCLKLQLPHIDKDAWNLNRLNASTVENASQTITVINELLERLSTERARMGAYSNRLEHTDFSLKSTAIINRNYTTIGSSTLI